MGDSLAQWHAHFSFDTDFTTGVIEAILLNKLEAVILIPYGNISELFPKIWDQQKMRNHIAETDFTIGFAASMFSIQ